MKARYRRLTDPDSALHSLLERVGPKGKMDAERIPAERAAGRYTAEAVFAAISSPPYHSSAMDGIAVVSEATVGASPTTPKVLTSPGQAVPIDTGDPIPEGYDAVVPVEVVNPAEGGFEIQAAAPARQHVRLTGEDMVAGEMILPGGRLLTPAHVGAMLGAGVTSVAVRRLPRVAILPTGDELCEPGQDPSGGKVIESNSRMLAAFVRQWGGEPVRLEPAPDDVGELTRAVRGALDDGCDVLLVLAGSSAGRDDYTPQLFENEGDLLFHGLTMMPGKPTAAGMIAGRPVIGVPGFPVSAAVAADRLLRPLLAHLLGVAPGRAERLDARLARALASRPGLEEIIRVVVGRFADGWVAAPLGRGAGAITTLSRAHGLISVPPASEGLAAGSQVRVDLLVPVHVLEQGLLLAGSNDLALSVLDDMLGAKSPGRSLNVSPLGSLAGLAALARGEAHLAGAHLLDPETGVYNTTDVARVLPGREVALVTLAHRQQGLCLRPDDERDPKDLAGVIAANMRWVNRQPGSGTRVLTDHLLAKTGLDPGSLAGWDHEEFTHVAVGEAVRSRAADCGMLILAAARALGLRFVPLAEERFDLVIPREAFGDDRIQTLIEVLRSPAFRERMEGLGGYDGRETGKVQCLPEGTWSASSAYLF